MDTVNHYMASLPPDVKTLLQRVRKAIREAAPQAKEKIGYKMPGYSYLGPLVYFAAYKNHCSLFGISKAIREKYAEELKLFKFSGSTIQFTTHRPLPVTLLKKMVKARLKENSERKTVNTNRGLSGTPEKSRQPNKK